MRYLSLSVIIVIVFVSGSCVFKGESELSKALSVAVKERKLSQRKMEYILTEYEKVRVEDKSKARQYVTSILGAIEMGGDSTHIDAARREVLKIQRDGKNI